MRLILTVLAISISCLAAHVNVARAQDVVVSPTLEGAIFDKNDWAQNVYQHLTFGTKIIDKETDFNLAPPPANLSKETADELAFMVKIAQTKRNEKTLAQIDFENSGVEIYQTFEQGGYFNIPSNPKLYDLSRMADGEQKYFTVKYKEKFMRARPSVLYPALDLAIPNPGHPAYPSGHAGQAWMQGLLLSYVDPEYKDAYMKFAKSVGFRREIAGVHYPSDSAAGRDLAEKIFAKLMENPVFVKKLDEAKEAFVRADLSKAYVVTEFEGE